MRETKVTEKTEIKKTIGGIKEGRIIKGIGGFYYVDTADGCFECRARGSFRKRGVTPLVGDKAIISVDEASGSGSVDELLPRKNVLLRPPVANVTQMAVVAASANPKPNLYLLDKVLASAEMQGLNILVCINKTDLDDGAELCSIYKQAGFDVLHISAKNGENIEVLRDRLKDNVTVFAGNSGVGKSSILNRIIGRETFETGEVSEKAERGKHTTRHSELLALAGGGYIIDTPGFGTLEIPQLSAENCAVLFREFAPFTDGCKFRDCSHTVEKGCCVLDAVNEKKIPKSRHENYVRLVRETAELNRRKG